MAKKILGTPVLIAVTSVLVIAGVVFIKIRPAKLDSFARCLKDKNTVFYGAFWCPHCQNQKRLFGRSARLLPYVECSTPDGKGQKAVCQEKNIEGYPTWEFADGSREGGEVTLQKLSEKTDCSLP